VLRYRRYLWRQRKTLYLWNLRRESARKGFLDGRTLWQALAIAAYGGRTIRRVLRKEPELVATARLEPGTAIQIETIDPRANRKG
jgi:hypothetical protein